MYYLLWLGFGIIAVLPLLWYASRISLRGVQIFLGRSLIVAAVIYLGFALISGDPVWLVIEGAGVFIYGVFYWLARRFSIIWLAVGWLMHPAWDAILHLYGPGAQIAPSWYAVACISFDVAVAVYIAYRQRQGHMQISGNNGD